MNRNLQPGIHPDADRLSVFVEGAATAYEQERMLAHLAECAECRKAVFLMQPHEEPQKATATPEKGWVWHWLVPVGLPSAALACALIAVLVYVRPHSGAPQTPQQVASAKPPQIERPATSISPTPDADSAAPTVNPDRDARSGRLQNGALPGPAAKETSRHQSPIARSAGLPALEKEQAGAGTAAQETGAAPSASVSTEDSSLAQNTVESKATSDLPLSGRNVMDLQQLQPADTKSGASQGGIARDKDLPPLAIQRNSSQYAALAGISGRITDSTGAVIAGVTVTLRDAAGKTRQTTTGADGSFHLSDLPAGQYGLTAAASGFRTSQQSIELKPSELAMLQAKLDIGTASEVVEVTGGAVSIQTESASLSSQAVAELSRARQISPLPSGMPVTSTVSHGNRFLSLDDAGNLFLSHNVGKKWKKVKPSWLGKAIRIELAPASTGDASAKARIEAGAAGEGAVFLLTTDGGTVWSSKDGAHWHQQ